MTRIDFHTGVNHRVHYACRVIRKARTAQKRAVVYTALADRLAQFDQALWTFSALDFVPHVLAGSPFAATTPVILARDAGSAPDSDVLLTLDDDVPPDFEQFFARYERVIEVVSSDDADRQSARARFKAYRERGFQPTAIEVKNGN
ncbi:MAG TPA: DNA polymerase III subunit chi [Burkholderiaceae bacterium]|nr:DNA polymerase III subunit chi [Burkholderiaceae bacterium]